MEKKKINPQLVIVWIMLFIAFFPLSLFIVIIFVIFWLKNNEQKEKLSRDVKNLKDSTQNDIWDVEEKLDNFFQNDFIEDQFLEKSYEEHNKIHTQASETSSTSKSIFDDYESVLDIFAKNKR